ncbi:MAG: PrsW family intramembrane metalloprotease [Bacteroidales bacterium]|nr:PrsW family intramembrane metalloprotease [Bacteroidales bacterium]
MYTNYLISAAVTLLIAILMYIYLGLRFRKGSSSALLLVFFLGIISIALNVFSVYLTNEAGFFPLGGNIKRVAFYALVTAGFVREFGKFLAIRIASFSRKDLNNPADGIVYSVMASLGFTLAALIWNIIFFQEDSQELYRSFLTLPANIITAIILGFFLGLGEQRKNRFIDSMTGLIAATLFHAVFEFSMLTSDVSLILVVFTGSIVIVGILISKAISLSTS